MNTILFTCFVAPTSQPSGNELPVVDIAVEMLKFLVMSPVSLYHGFAPGPCPPKRGATHEPRYEHDGLTNEGKIHPMFIQLMCNMM
jgi:hypothetical protein